LKWPILFFLSSNSENVVLTLVPGVFRLDARHSITENGRDENQSWQTETGEEETQMRHSLMERTRGQQRIFDERPRRRRRRNYKI
jgi:hypothetical protein